MSSTETQDGLVTDGILDLADPRARDHALVGSKAAALAMALQAGLSVLPGFVVTIPAVSWAGRARRRLPGELLAPLRAAWDELTMGGRRPLVVRSSSSVEDTATSSMAGRFTSLVDVRDWDGFLASVEEVLASSYLGTRDEADPAPMGVLVQPRLDPAAGGVLFGADPVTGRRDRVMVAAVKGAPHDLVQGSVPGTRYTLGRHGRLVDHERGAAGADLDRGQRRRLLRLSTRAQQLFGAPQDIEWAFDADGGLWLLQSRPITAMAASRKGRGPVLGPGPVAETFPDALAPLEEDLWVGPLRQAVAEALRLAGVASARRLRRSPVVTAVGGHVAIDLELIGARPRRHTRLAAFDPRPPARRLRAAWRVGRLRAALPSLAGDVLTEADIQLAEVPALAQLSDAQLLSILHRSQQALVALHGYEILVGLLLTPGSGTTTGAEVAVRMIAAARAQGHDDQNVVARHPVTLALVAPAIGPHAALPDIGATPTDARHRDDRPVDDDAVLREALRLRARWVHELSARAAWELAERLAAGRLLAAPGDVRLLRHDELVQLVRTRSSLSDLAGRAWEPAAPLPAAFRLDDGGAVLPVQAGGSKRHAGCGTGAGGGRGHGPVHVGEGIPTVGAVLVVRTLEPALAAVLPRLAGLVSETGSPLSHLAILAREMHVPVVVGVADALTRFAPGTAVVVDGDTGEVSLARPSDGDHAGAPDRDREVDR